MTPEEYSHMRRVHVARRKFPFRTRNYFLPYQRPKGDTMTGVWRMKVVYSIRFGVR